MITPTLPAIALATAGPTTPPASEIQKIRQVIQEKVREKLQQISQKEVDLKRAITATITKIENNTLFFDTHSLIKNATVDNTTVYIGLKQNKIKYSDLKIGQEVLIIGLLDENQQFTAKRLILTPQKNFQNPHQIIFGRVVDISTSSPVLVVIPYSDKNNQYQIKYTPNKTKFLSKIGQKISLESIKVGQKIAVVATTDLLSHQSLVSIKIIVLD
jgi:hypothetical protein